MSCRPLQSLPPTETLDLPNGLSLTPRVKILLTFFRSDPSVKPIDEWLLKSSLLDFLKPSLSIPEDDLHIHRSQDLKKRKREDPVASGTLYVRNLGFLNRKTVENEEEEAVEALEKRFLEWRNSFLGRIDGIELNIKGVKFRLSASIPDSDDFDRVNKSWEEFYAFDGRGAYYSRGARYRPDTLVLEGVPSRWFAEPRVSSKPSMLVTHTIFSVFGKIRKLNVAGDDDLGKTMEEPKEQGIVSGLQCKIWVQFENYQDFFNAMKVLCGRSIQKQGSRLRVDYDVTWDRDGYFRNLQRKTSTNQVQERGSQMLPLARDSKHEAPRLQSQVTRLSSDDTRSKRFRD
ncbi:hypothetical protein AAC387_Pa02g3157 [Persea americana]